MYTNNTGYKKPYNTQKQPQRPKKEVMTFSIVPSFSVYSARDDANIEIDHESVIGALQTLQSNGTFEVLTENVGISKALVMSDSTKKGNAVIGFINKFDFDKQEVDITVYGNSVENVTNLLKKGTRLFFEPKVIAYNGEFRCFNGFNLVEG